MTGRVVVVIAAALAFGIPSGSVAAQGFSFGPRIGFGISPGTLSFGAQGHSPISSIENLSFEPVVQVDLGDGFDAFEAAGRARYDVQDDGDLTIFALAGIVLYRVSVDVPEIIEDLVDESRTDVGLTLGGGVEKNGLGAEATFGVSAISDLQLMVRYRFGWNN